MDRPNTSSEPTFGFLSTLEAPEYGYFGGYLLISVMGRPLEFHCTAPMRPSRAQQILYGPTLEPYLLGEQIGGTLLREAQIAPRVVLTDRAATLCLRATHNVPMVLVGGPVTSIASTPASDQQLPRGQNSAASAGYENTLHCGGSSSGGYIAGGYELQSAYGFESDQPLAMELLTALAKYVDLSEPFDRIHEAIREAQRLGERSQDFHGQAAA